VRKLWSVSDHSSEYWSENCGVSLIIALSNSLQACVWKGLSSSD
nr:hypothetical protein [Tanacetum cinerariifolium]